MNTIINHINEYVRLLKREFSLDVSIHDEYLCCMAALTELNIHTNPFCLCMKTYMPLWQECITRQRLISEKCRSGERFFGMCHAGVCEYIYPLNYFDDTVGFISISGYRPPSDDAQNGKAMYKLTKLCRRFELDFDSVKSIYERCLVDRLPDENRLDALINPLCDLLTLCYRECKSAEQLGVTSREESSKRRLYYEISNQIRREHNSRVDLDSLSRRLNYSKSYISHIFKSYSGMTINSYVNKLRITEAKAMLSSTELSIGEIAHAIGFSDSNYFSNVFRSECKLSPRKWRAIHSIKA